MKHLTFLLFYFYLPGGILSFLEYNGLPVSTGINDFIASDPQDQGNTAAPPLFQFDKSYNHEVSMASAL